MEKNIENKNEEIIDIVPEQKLSKIIKLKIIGLVAINLIVITSVFLVGYFQFGWFQKNQDNIISNTYHQNQVLLFNEFKTISTEISTRNGKETIDQNIDTDFLVVINSKAKLNYFGEIDNLYNATLVILKTLSNKQIVGGLNLTDEEEAEKSINNPGDDEHPIAKFAFYENGTLIDIHLANDTKQFYASSMVDLIENIIPRISKKLFNQTQKGVEFTYDKEENDPSIKTIMEEHLEKEFVDKYSKIVFKGSQINKRIKRHIYNDNINQIKSESELNLVSEKNNEEGNFLDIGLDGYSIKVNSDLNIIENKDDKELIKKIDLITKRFKFEESQKLLEELSKKEMKDLLDLTKEVQSQNQNDKLNENELRRLGSNVGQSYDLISINVLGKRVDFKYVVDYNNGRASHYLEARVGGATVRLSTSSLSASGGIKGGITAPICTIPFTLGIPLTFRLLAKGDFNNQFTFKSNYRRNGNIITVSGTLNAYLDGALSSSAKFISLKVWVEGRVVGLSGSKTIDIESHKLSGTISATTGPIKLYVNVKLVKNNYSKVLVQSGSLSKRF